MKHNEAFVNDEKYASYKTTKFPDKKIVLLTCMDTRLTDLLPQAMNIHHGEAKVIKNAGATIDHRYGSVMRSILVAIYELGADEVFIVGHHGCGMSGLSSESVLSKAKDRGILNETISELSSDKNIDMQTWLSGFESVEENVKQSVEMVCEHPLLPQGTTVHGLVICPETGRLDVIVSGGESLQQPSI
nr:carbonic anhydrase [Texcoconibacillus texcoconensis]